MDFKINVPTTFDVKYVSVSIAVRYEEEDIPNDFPLRDGDIWNATIEVETGKILNWPKGQDGYLQMKVCDEGTYHLLDADKNMVASIVDNYVPNQLIPGEFGDYVELDINADGVIKNWPKNPSFQDFAE